MQAHTKLYSNWHLRSRSSSSSSHQPPEELWAQGESAAAPLGCHFPDWAAKVEVYVVHPTLLHQVPAQETMQGN
jgi:hypothetical protein